MIRAGKIQGRIRLRHRRGSADCLRFSRGLRLLAALVLVAGFLPSPAAAETEAERADRLKAAFILNIAKFVTWPQELPANPGATLQLCLHRRNPLADAMRALEGKTVNGRALRVAALASLEETAGCNILLVGQDDIFEFEALARQAPKAPRLTIADLTESTPPPHTSALIALVRDQAHIGFEINLAAAERAGLLMSSNLLKLAKIIGDGN